MEHQYGRSPIWTDFGPDPYTTNLDEATKQNGNFRMALWTGENLQMTLMSLRPGQDIGLEVHPYTDQFIKIEQGNGMTQMGNFRDCLKFRRQVKAGDGIFIPAGTWHNLTNIGNGMLKLYSVYGPADHPYGTVHKTKADALIQETY